MRKQWSHPYMSAEPTTEPCAPGTPEHLGGHHFYTNMDRPVFDYLVGRYEIRTMLDVGCGTGGMVDYAVQSGLDYAVGVDGDPLMNREAVWTHDFTNGPFRLPMGRVDLIWCVEFVEHVEKAYLPNILETFRCARVLFVTHAMPGQGGHHHVNLQTDDYWIDKLGADWQLDYEATGWVRVHSGVVPYIRHNGLVFTRRA